MSSAVFSCDFSDVLARWVGIPGRISDGKIDNSTPFLLDTGDELQLGDGNGYSIGQSHMRSEEIVVGGKQGGDADGTVCGFETIGRAGVVSVGTIEALGDLLKMAIRFGLLIEVL